MRHLVFGVMSPFFLLTVFAHPALATRSNQAPSRRLPLARADDQAARVAAIAEAYFRLQPRLQREDCSGLIEQVLAESGVLRQGNVRMFWRRAIDDQRAYRGRLPKRGDLVFFDHTYDADRDGQVDDILTHIGIVTSVEEDGTLTLVHRPRGGIKKLRANLYWPATRRHGDRVLNDVVRATGYGDKGGRRLAGQLIYGFAHPPRPLLLDLPGRCDTGESSS